METIVLPGICRMFFKNSNGNKNNLFSVIRSSFIFCVLPMIVVFVASCEWKLGSNLKVGEGNLPPGHLKLNMNQFNCLIDLDKKVDKYLNGNMPAEEVTRILTCVRSALTKFQFLTRDNSDGSYSAASLVHFLNTEYLIDNPITPKLTQEIMKLKVVLLGGLDTKVTKVEINSILQLVKEFEDQAILNIPYVRIYRQIPGASIKELSLDKFEDAVGQLKSTADFVSNKLSLNKQFYSMNDLRNLISEVQKFLHWKQFHINSVEVDRLINLIQAYKGVVTNGRSDVMLSSDWDSFLKSSAEIYAIYLRFHLFVEDKYFTYGPELNSLITSVENGFQLIKSIIQDKNNHLISFAEIENLINAFGEMNLLPFDIRNVSMNNTIKYFILNGLRDSNGANNAQGVRATDINEIKNEFNVWSKTQKVLSLTASEYSHVDFLNSSATIEMNHRQINSFDFSSIIFSRDFQNIEPIHIISDLVKNLRPMFSFDDERLYIAPLKDLREYSAKNNIHNLTHVNVIRSLIRLLFRTFSRSNGPRDYTGINSDELQHFYEVVKPLGVDLKFMNPDNFETGKRVFIEGNLFTYSGSGVSELADDPNDYLTFYEMEELLSLMWSGGQLRNRFYNSILESCRKEQVPDGPLDHVGVIKINRVCFFKHFTDNNLSEFSNMPNMTRVLRANIINPKHVLSDKFIKLKQNLQLIALPPCLDNSKYIEFSEIATIITVLHYAEVLFAKYDLNENDSLSFEEIMKAFSRFNGYIARQARVLTGEDQSVSMIKAIFAFILNYQRLPNTDLTSVDGISDAATLYGYKIWYFNNDPNEFFKDKSTVVNLDPSSEASAPHLTNTLANSEDQLTIANASALLPTRISIDRFDIVNVLKVLAQSNKKPEINCSQH
ncbi:MAG: hypothetical protein ABL927_06150 [Bdellovibrionales bacterium]